MSAPGEADAIGLCLAGAISPQVALSRLLLGGGSAGELAAVVKRRRPAQHAASFDAWRALSRLLCKQRGMLSRLAGEIADTGSNHAGFAGAGAGAAEGVAAFFDRAVAFSPEASVALYSLGDPAILAEATAEIVAWLDRTGCLPPRADVLDLGCGIGRVSAALAAQCRSVLGLDVSAGMIAEARRRCAAIPNLRLERTAGLDLNALPDQGFDLLLAVDAFPYVLQAGAAVVAAHLAGAARILRPGGHLVILNLSYGRPPRADEADAADWAAAHRFELRSAGGHPFTLWDGAAFVLRKPG